MLAALREPWWRAWLVGFLFTLAFLAVGAWQLTVLAAAVAGFLAGRGRAGGIRGIQATTPAWFVWLIALSLISPVDDVVVLLGSILGAGWGLVVLLTALIPTLLGIFGGLAGGYLAELIEKERKSEDPAAPEPAAR